MPKHPDIDTQAQFILHAVVYGDDAAVRRFNLSARSLRKYRQEAREEGSELAKTFRRYADAVSPERRAGDFSAWLLDHVRKTSELLLDKAKEVKGTNPEGIKAIDAHVATLLQHAAALEYIGRLFAPAPADDGEDGDDE